jgi:myo-inositol-1(or 4)-monophosphatase
MDYLQFATSIAKEAGAIIRKNFSFGMTKEWKGDGTPLTETDKAINSLVIRKVQENFPEHSVLGEEESSSEVLNEFTWVCDPVDGTIPFSHGLPTSVFSLALCKNGEPIVGVIYDPYMDRLFAAEKGKGATLNGVPTKVSTTTSLNHAVLGVDGPPHAPLKVDQIFRPLTDRGALVITLRGICYSGMLVAAGEFVGAIMSGITPWDGAALGIIIPEAGGIITGLNGEAQRYDREINGFIASNGLVHKDLVNIIGALTIS